MTEQERLAQQFEHHRRQLQAMAYRMLGSLSEAEDAVQEAWLRLDRADVSDVRNLRGWLTTVVTRLCLDMLRTRKARGEEPLGEGGNEPIPADSVDPEQEMLLADSVGLALLVVLETLAPAERLAFVLHDMFDLPFATIGPMVGRSPNATAQLAARARRRIRGRIPDSRPDLIAQRRAVDAFLTAARNGDMGALVTLLDDEVVLYVDRTAAGRDAPLTVRGARRVAAGASMFFDRARYAEPALIDGAVGVVVAPRGRLWRVLMFGVRAGKIAQFHVWADEDRLRRLDITALDDARGYGVHG